MSSATSKGFTRQADIASLARKALFRRLDRFRWCKHEVERSIPGRSFLWSHWYDVFHAPLAGHPAVHDDGVEGLRKAGEVFLHPPCSLAVTTVAPCNPQEHRAFKFAGQLPLLLREARGHESRLRADGRHRFRNFRLNVSRCHRGQADFNEGAAVRSVVRGDISAMLLDDAIANAQSEPGAFAHAFGGIEGIKDALGVFDSGPSSVNCVQMCPPRSLHES